MLGQLIKVFFHNNQFTISQDNSSSHRFRRGDRWLLEVKKGYHKIDIKPISVNHSMDKVTCNSSSQELSFLWHQRMGHLSIISFNKMLKYNASDGTDNSYLQTICLYHPCSVAKSEHQLVKNTSRNLVWKPGDVIVVDLIGPLPVSINHMKYTLVIQDVFLSVVVAIPIMEKTDAKSKLQDWMTQFMNVINNTIRVLRSDNVEEFKNNNLEQFLESKGIIHEFPMPYEHHQNSRIKQTN
ncbi:hypothetical protein O181_016678 [Austropuccinia psidii MF-1]|uniref:Integrase catalytic domain-containing protein n=1 Tax=Austropuccinia psidii MF-1 TaxID=1389203 RepID=A0A9Q3GR40_9BASI|nr:hypothetical protein [Austropuccinia psidii MF-1]